jgi:DNA-binding SARP family transcriptional activator/Tfp pilus assembly protein PilF
MFTLRCLGGFIVESERGPLVGRAAQKKRLALLALLATAPMGRLSRDKLTGLLWPASDGEHARHQLASSVYELRKAFGEAAILSVGDDLQLNPDTVVSDVARFEAACRQRTWDHAAVLYRGPFLDGFFLDGTSTFERWLDGERERLSALYAGALQALAHEAEQAGDRESAVLWWHRLVEHAPYNTHFTLRLMQALDAAGDRAGALQQARLHDALLRTELDLEADPRISALADRLRAPASEHQPTAHAYARSRSRNGSGMPYVPVAAPVARRPLAPAQRPHVRLGVVVAAALVVAGIGLSSHRWLDRIRERSTTAALQPDPHRLAAMGAGTPDLEAYDLYLQGRYHWNLASVADTLTQQRALAYYRRAVERDPQFALAYAGMADAYSHANQPMLARASAMQAISLDAAQPAGYTALAYVLAFFEWNWLEAERQLDRAIELDPDDVLAYLRRANVRAAVGRHDEAIADVERAVHMAPLSFLVSYNRGLVYYWAGRYDEAVRFLRHTLAMDSSRADVRRELAHAHLGRGDAAEAAALYRSVGDTIYVVLAAGDRDDVAALIHRLETQGADLPAATLAYLFARLGMHDSAFAALEAAVQSRDRWIPFQLRFPALAPLHADPRFGQLRQAMGLAPF